jgi:hypothetical protein
MHSGFMTWAVVGFAGSALLACVKHDDATFPNLPPADATAPTRHVVDSGLVTLSMDAPGSGPSGIGSFAPDAKESPDATVDLASPDLAGFGTPCDPVTGIPCQGQYRFCQLNPATAATTCQLPGAGDLPAGVSCSPGLSVCNPGLFCATGFCANLCHLASPVECTGGSGSCHRIGAVGSMFGYCE